MFQILCLVAPICCVYFSNSCIRSINGLQIIDYGIDFSIIKSSLTMIILFKWCSWCYSLHHLSFSFDRKSSFSSCLMHSSMWVQCWFTICLYTGSAVGSGKQSCSWHILKSNFSRIVHLWVDVILQSTYIWHLLSNNSALSCFLVFGFLAFSFSWSTIIDNASSMIFVLRSVLSKGVLNSGICYLVLPHI